MAGTTLQWNYATNAWDTLSQSFDPTPVPFDTNDYLIVIGAVMLAAFIVMLVLLAINIRSRWVGSISREEKPCLSIHQSWPDSENV